MIGNFDSSYLATGLDPVTAMLKMKWLDFSEFLNSPKQNCLYLTQSRSVEWGAATKIGASVPVLEWVLNIN